MVIVAERTRKYWIRACFGFGIREGSICDCRNKKKIVVADHVLCLHVKSVIKKCVTYRFWHRGTREYFSSPTFFVLPKKFIV